jgi:hypothetical protein
MQSFPILAMVIAAQLTAEKKGQMHQGEIYAIVTVCVSKN